MNKKIVSLLTALCLTVASTNMIFATSKCTTNYNSKKCITNYYPNYNQKKCKNKDCIIHTSKYGNYKNSLISYQQKFLQKVNAKRAYKDVVYLSDTIGPRVSTTQEEYTGAKYIQKQFRNAGYSAKIVPFDVYGSSTGELKVGDTVLNARVFSNSAETTGITGEAVYCGLGTPEEIAKANVTGKIAFIQRGTLTYKEKVKNATEAGAIAVVMFNNSGSNPTSGQSERNYVPAMGISLSDGEAILDRMNAGETITFTLKVDPAPVSTSWNVVASKKATNKKSKHKNEIVCVTAHMDSVPLAPGANDNASGSSAMMEIARAMKNLPTDREIRFIACGSEEVGLLGSAAYVASLSEKEKSRIVGDFNMDMIATAYEPCTELTVFTNSGEENILTEIASRSGKKLACLSTESVSYDGEYDGFMNSSDHVSFDNAGLTSVLFANSDPAKKDDPRAAAEPYYHKPSDNITNFSVDRLERTIKLVGISVYEALNMK